MKRSFKLKMSLLFISLELIKQILLFKDYGYFVVKYFPFQFCSTIMYALLLSAIFNNYKNYFDNYIADFCLLAGIMTFFDTSGLKYSNNLLTFISYFWHILMIIVSLFVLFKEKEVKLKDFKYGLFIFGIFVFAATLLNILLTPLGEIDLFYISPYENVYQLIFKDIAKIIGTHLTHLFYLFMIVLGAFLIHLFRTLIFNCCFNKLNK